MRPSRLPSVAISRISPSAQFEIEDLRVFRKPLHFAGAGDDDDVLLHQKAQADLHGGLLVRRADAGEHLVATRVSARDRAIGDHRHAVGATGFDYFRLVEKGMALDLIAHQRFARRRQCLVDVRHGEVGDADMACQAVALDLAQRADGVGQRDLRIGPVQQQQIDLA